MTAPYRLPPHDCLAEPRLLFHPERASDSHAHPLRGLLDYGPFSRSLVNTVADPIRVAIIAPTGEARMVTGLIAECEQPHRPQERKQYLPDFPGFQRVFGVRVVAANAPAIIELPATADDELGRAAAPHVVLAERLAQSLRQLASVRHEFDVVAIYLPDRWSPGFFGPDGDDFDLHAFLKATAAGQRIATQLLRESRVMRYGCRCSVAWRLGIALYVKAGGTPWRLADVEAETAFVGIGYALRFSADGRPQFVTCCSQVFDADGTGLEFLVYSTSDFRTEGENPFLSRGEMQRVMSRSLDLYQRRHAGRSPARITVHKTTEFKRDEVDGCFDAFRSIGTVDLSRFNRTRRGAVCRSRRRSARANGVGKQVGTRLCAELTYR